MSERIVVIIVGFLVGAGGPLLFMHDLIRLPDVVTKRAWWVQWIILWAGWLVVVIVAPIVMVLVLRVIRQP